MCVLADKIERRGGGVAVDYVGFTIPNVFVVGYGFDHAGSTGTSPTWRPWSGA